MSQAKPDIFQSDRIAKLTYAQILEFRNACSWLTQTFLICVMITRKLNTEDRRASKSFLDSQARLKALSKCGDLTSLSEAQSILHSLLAFLERCKLLLAPAVIDMRSMAENIIPYFHALKQGYVRFLTQSNIQLQRNLLDPSSSSKPLVRILKIFRNLRSRASTQLNRTGAAPQPIIQLNEGTSRGRNFGTNRGTNSGINYGVNEGTNSGINKGINRGTNGGYNAGISCGTNPGRNFGINLCVNSGINIGINLGTNPGINTGVSSRVNSGHNFGWNAGSMHRSNDQFGTVSTKQIETHLCRRPTHLLNLYLQLVTKNNDPCYFTADPGCLPQFENFHS